MTTNIPKELQIVKGKVVLQNTEAPDNYLQLWQKINKFEDGSFIVILERESFVRLVDQIEELKIMIGAC